MKCFGQVNGTNNIFKTPERRRLTDFSANADARLGAFLDDDEVNQPVSSDDLEKGEFTITTPPVVGRKVEATYFLQWFNDDEIDGFLSSGGQFILCTDNIIGINPGFEPAVLNYAGSEAFTYLATRPESLTATYRITDRKTGKAIEIPLASHYNTMSDRLFKKAKTLREDFYTRKDQAKAPLFGNVTGRVRVRTPPR